MGGLLHSVLGIGARSLMVEQMAFLLLSLMASSAKADYYLNEFKIMPGHTIFNDHVLPIPSSYLRADDLPTGFSW